MKKSNKISENFRDPVQDNKRGASCIGRILTALVQFSIGIELGAIFIPGFSDMWRKTFPLWTNLLGRFSGLFPFSVGELMIFTGLIWLTVLVLLLISAVISGIRKAVRNDTTHVQPDCHSEKSMKFLSGFRRLFLRSTNFILTYICVVMVFNCFCVYHCTRLRTHFAKASAQDQSASADEQGFTLEELTALRDFLVEKCNSMSLIMERDQDGEVISPGEKAMQEEARRCMVRLSSRFGDLSGYQTTPKPLLASSFMCQQNMMGYFFPFSMEANYNTLMTDLCKPFTMCHELAHTHGYIYEDEANFLAYLACLSSDDSFFVYSGYLNVLHYVNNDFYYAVSEDVYWSHPEITDLVYFDSDYLRDDVRAYVEEHAVIPTEVVKEGAELFVDTTLKANGVAAGKKSYNEVVELLLYEARNQ